MAATPFITGKYFQLISEGEAKFLYEHSEKQLKDTLDANTLIVTRLTSLITIVATLTVALFGYALHRHEDHSICDPMLQTAIFAIVYLFVISVLLFCNIQPNAYYSVGAEPVDLVNEQLFNERNGKYRLTALYVNEIHEYQKRLKANKRVNRRRWRLYKAALILLVCSPVALALAYLVLKSLIR